MTKIVPEVSGMGTRRRVTESVATRSPARLGRILVVEDEQDVAELVRYHLSKEGYDVRVSTNGADALRQVREVRPELVLLDIMVPQLNGWEVCRRLKQDPQTRGISVIMVTGRVEEGDKVLGFEMGADDYVTKPFSPRELLARVRAVLRRGAAVDTREAKHHLKAGELEIDRHRFEVKMQGRVVELTRKEFDLLAVLVATPGRVFGREELLDLVWGRDGFVEPRTVDVHVARLRAKFSADKLPEPGIDTVRGVGYRFRDARDES
jgi:DNA-binding response OmpR family regulator